MREKPNKSKVGSIKNLNSKDNNLKEEKSLQRKKEKRDDDNKPMRVEKIKKEESPSVKPDTSIIVYVNKAIMEQLFLWQFKETTSYDQFIKA